MDDIGSVGTAASGLVSLQHVQAAWLFLHGTPDVRGDWSKACKEAGFTGRSPSVGSANTLTALAIVKDIVSRQAEMPEDEDMKAIAEAMQEHSDPNWLYLAPFARRVMAKIAAGKLAEATSYQVAALKEILLRAEGKAGESRKKGEDDAVGVVILPTVSYQGMPVIDLVAQGITEREDDE